MKKLLFILITLVYFGSCCFAQVQDVRANRIIANQSVFVGTSGTYGRWVDTIYNDTTNMNSYVRSIPTNNAVYDFVVGRGNSLQTAINLKLNKTDTAAMLAGYTRRAELADTAASIRADFPGVLNGDKGDITVSGSGAVWTIDNDVVTYAKMQNVAASNRFLGRITSGSGNTEELTGTQATTILDVFSSALKGLSPASGGGTANFLRADGTWAVPPGGSGETNTASNLGGGLANYSTKVGVDLQFNSFKTADFNLASNLLSLDYINSQMANNAQNGFMTSAYAAKLDTNHYIMNVGGGYEWAFQLSDTVIGMRTLVIISGGTAVQTDSTIELTIAGGSGLRFAFVNEDTAQAIGIGPRIFQLNDNSLIINKWGNDPEDSITFRMDGQHINLKHNYLSGLFVGEIDIWGERILFNNNQGNYQFTTLLDSASASTKMVIWDSLTNKLFATAMPVGGGGGTVTDVLGTTNRITSTGGTTPDIDISATFEALLGKVANPLSQFAATTSAQLAGVLSDEEGSGGGFVRATSPTITTPNITSATLAAGTATAGTAPVYMTPGTDLTVSVSGAIEFDGTRFTGTTASGRGVFLSRMWARSTSDFTLANSNADQAVFHADYDVWTLQASTLYWVEGEYYIKSGAVSHSIAIGFTLAGGASLTATNYSTLSWPVAVNTQTASQTTAYLTQVTTTAVNAAAANAVQYVKFSGWLSVNAGGQFTPILKFSADPTGTCATALGSYIMFTAMGSNTAQFLGSVQ